MAIKRNATAFLPIEVGIPISSIRSIEFLFKKEQNPNAPEQLKKTLEKKDIAVTEGTSDESGFEMLLTLKPDETFRLAAGKCYMDTQIILNDGNVPVVPIVPVEDVLQTLYNEAYKDEG